MFDPFKVMRYALVLGISVFAVILTLVTSDCKSGGKTYKKGDIWYGKNTCHLYECGKGSTVTEYEKICPHIPSCLSSNVYTKDCCQYCHEGTLPMKDNGHDCKRKCISGQSMSCKYSFSAEVFQTFTIACGNCPSNVEDCNSADCIPADGISRLINVANRVMPGPAIEVCVNDTVVVDVSSGFISQSVSVHWHGITQKKTPYADGVPFVTQCSLRDFTQFRYVFKADTTGTYFWYSMDGLEVMDGFQGALIVRQPKHEDQLDDLYDEDKHIMFLQDWNHRYSDNKFYSHYMTNASLFPDNILINGRGRYIQREKPNIIFTAGPPPKPIPEIPYAEFRVKKNKRYRFRIINGANSNCPLAVSIDKHILTVISTDGSDIDPIELNELAITNGERYDVIVETDQKVDKYWIRVKGLLDCEQQKLQQFAILRYEGSSDGDPKAAMVYDYPLSLNVRTFHSTSINFDIIHLSDYESLEPLEKGIDTHFPHHQFFVNLNYTTTVKNSQLMASPDSPRADTFQYNGITFKPPHSPLLTQPLDDPSVICNATSLKSQKKDCSKELCSCVHILNVDLNSVVEIILFDPDTRKNVEHPIHLHGYKFRVVAQGRIPKITEQRIKQLDRGGRINRNYDSPVLKDTVSVPKSGYTIIRFKASNPGYWFMPTTVRFHLALGMALVLKVGESSDWPPVPPGLPTCFNYLAT